MTVETGTAAEEAGTADVGRARGWRPLSARDLPFVDAAAALIAVALAYALRAVWSDHFALGWATIDGALRGAGPVVVAALLLSAAALGLYADRAEGAGLREHASAALSATAVAVVAGAFWGALAPPTFPLALAMAVTLTLSVHFGRTAYRRFATSAS